MIKEIIKDEIILQTKSENFVIGEDDYLIQDMIDTANANIESCAGLACIQIGVAKRVILVKQGDKFIVYINPVIVKKSPRTYVTQEGCLSLDGLRTVKRHRQITLAYTNKQGKRKVQTFSGFTAQIIQHECDHLNGILI